MHQQWVAFSEQLQETFNALARIDWAEIDRRTTQELLRLAELGWTVAPWMTLPQVTHLATLDSAALDLEFSRLYFEVAGLKDTEDALIDSPHMVRWRPLLLQVFAALDRREHLIAIPALLLVLEGFVAQFADPTDSKQVCSTSVPNLLMTIRARDRGSRITGWLWASTAAFLSQLYKRAPFSEECPSFVNRHWILHGRNAVDWTIADALRVLNALSTLHWLMGIKQRQLEVTTNRG